jgi:type IV pilus assembly protein PilA
MVDQRQLPKAADRDARRTRRSTVKAIRNRRGGFTLIELMIVVAIIGILAAIAIPNFLRFQLKAKSSEGKTNLAAIRTAEESFFAEYGSYVSSDASPTTMNWNQKTPFVHANPGLGFDQVGWAPEGEVYFNYATNINASADQFTASAEANIDNDATYQVWGYKKGTQAGHAGHVGATACNQANLTPETVMPCTTASGQSEF